jgi:ATP-dependent Lhr-like helicase
MIGGEVVQYKNIREMTVQVERGSARDPKVPVFAGSRMPISTALADRVIAIMGDPQRWSDLPSHTQDWLHLQTKVSKLPRRDRLLIESFPRAEREHTVFWSFAGRNAHQTLGLIVTKRMEEAGLAPLGFVANDYALMIWGLDPIPDPAALIEAEGLRSGLDRWLQDSSLMKRTFRTSAVIAGLIERRFPGLQKSGRQATVSSDVLYDTLVKYDPDHLMLDITRREAMRGMVDFDRIEDLIDRTRGRTDHVKLTRLSPLAAPLMLEVGREQVSGSADERLLMETLGVEDMLEALG